MARCLDPDVAFCYQGLTLGISEHSITNGTLIVFFVPALLAGRFLCADQSRIVLMVFFWYRDRLLVIRIYLAGPGLASFFFYGRFLCYRPLTPDVIAQIGEIALFNIAA